MTPEPGRFEARGARRRPGFQAHEPPMLVMFSALHGSYSDNAEEGLWENIATS